jgi:hypothetical protein
MRLLQILGIFALLVVTAACVSGFNQAPASEQRTPDKVLSQGKWELQIFYRNQGTRSEGQHGVLVYQGKVVEAGSVGEEKETDLGRMRYYGPESEVAVPWASSGWNFSERGKIAPSWQK